MAGPMARLAAGTCTIFGSAWLIAFAFDRLLTPLLVESTVRTLNDPVVEEEVYQLLRTLLTTMMNDPGIRSKAPGFLKQVMSQETFEEAAKVLLSGAIETESYHRRAFRLMHFISNGILNNVNIETKLTKTTQEVVGMLHRATSLTQHVPLQPFTLQAIPRASAVTALSSANFEESMQAFKDKISQFELQDVARKLRLESQLLITLPSATQPQTIPVPQLDYSAPFSQTLDANAPAFLEMEQRLAARKLELEQQEAARILALDQQETARILAFEQQEAAKVREIEMMEAARLAEQIGASELQPPQVLERTRPSAPLPVLEQSETHYLTY